MRGLGASPNIVLVVADDLGIGDIGAYGGRLIRTPNMDLLATQGVRCESMYAAAATDTPARAGMLVGRFGARYNLPASVSADSAVGLPLDAVTVARLLRQTGYVTGLFGQWRLGARAGQHPLDHGFDRFAGTLYGTDVAPLTWYEGKVAVETEFDPAFAARRITQNAMDFVSEHREAAGARGEGRPFFAVLSHLAPHAPFRAEPRFFGTSRAGLYGDVVEQLDHYLGLLVRHLREARHGRRTLIIFTSDNGPRYEGRTQARRGRKPEVFDGGVRVPFLATWTNGGRNMVDRVPRSLLDLTPSLCALAGAGTPTGLDGADMSPLLAGHYAPERGPVFLFYNEYLNAMRSGRWKLHVAYGSQSAYSRVYMPQLFDTEADFRENYNVANLHPDVVSRLQARLDRTAADVAAEAAARSEKEMA